MEESHKTTALKKAYAEIILNTAKESAARDMVFDRKSARFHHDLSETKEEALRLLVRLKHMIDAKTIEADVISSNQQRQIDVLEAQLHEAEDIITDLRSEVRWVRDGLEKAKAFESQERVSVLEGLVSDQEDRSSLMHDVECENDENLEKAKASESQERKLVNMEEEMVSAHKVVVHEEVADTCRIHDDEKQFDGLSVVDTLMGNGVCESELDGDISRIKKLELSRNGCTQRVHALERIVLERQSSSSADEEEENLSSGKSGNLGNTRCLVLALRASSAEVVTMPSNALGIKKTRKLRGRRKRRFGKPKARSQSQLIKPCQPQSNLTCSKTSTSDGEDSVETHLPVESDEVDDLKTCKELKEDMQLKRSPESGEISVIRKEKRSKTMHETHHFVEACQESNLVSISVEDAEKETNKTKPLPRLTSRKEDVLVSYEGEEDSVVPCTKLGSNLVSLHSDSKVTAVLSDQISESPPRANVNRLLKYTFQRKRKRGSTNTNDVSNN